MSNSTPSWLQEYSQVFTKQHNVKCHSGHIHQNNMPAVGFVFARLNECNRLELLLDLRSGTVEHPNTWGFIGGDLKSIDEEPLDAAYREAREEYGIDANDINILGLRYTRDHGGVKYLTYTYIFAGYDGQAPVPLTNESLQSQWFALDALPANLMTYIQEDSHMLLHTLYAEIYPMLLEARGANPPNLAQAQAQPQCQAQGQCQAQAQPQPQLQAQFQALALVQARVQALAQAQADVQAQAHALAEALTLAQAQAQAQPQLQLQLQLELQPQVQALAQAQAQALALAQAQAEAQAEAEAQTQALAQALAQAQAEAQAEAEAQAQALGQTQALAQAQGEAQAQAYQTQVNVPPVGPPHVDIDGDVAMTDNDSEHSASTHRHSLGFREPTCEISRP
ncbi:NUDIX hydrolase domain-like protein [Xylaria cf. heliscus]|nr:NUDIX hydrolase domain-like protein [Xylaria cf. heliscus]